MKSPRIYFAGPDVFRRDAKKYFHDTAEVARGFGIEPIFPADVLPQENDTPISRGYVLFSANIGLIQSCDGIIANISPFRGPNMDPGTAMEIGCGFSLGKPMIGWSSDLRQLMDRTLDAFEHLNLDATSTLIEDFGLPENLMINFALAGIYRNCSEAMLSMTGLLFGATKRARA